MDKQGFLVKEGGRWKTWKKRYFVLKNGILYYSKKQDGGHIGIIDLKISNNIGDIQYKKKVSCFFVETPKRTYFLSAPNDGERSSWIKVLCEERDRLQGKLQKSDGTAIAPMKYDKIGLEDFVLLKVIGKGSFGKVFQVRKKDNDKIYAMKVLNKKSIIDRHEIKHTQTEKNILQKLIHPFLVNLYFSFQTEDKLYFVMDYVNGGELFYHLQKDKKFSEDRVRFYCSEICLGLEYLHANGVLYRDLKPENLLLTDDGHICMTDFGISKEGLIAEDDRTATFCGTPEYLAPEVLEGNGYGKGVDWWSFGTLMFEMLTGLPPFYSTDVQQMYSKIMRANLAIPENISPEARAILQGLLERDPKKRLCDPKQIKAHVFFRGINWEKLLAKEVQPPFIPQVKGKTDTSLVDPIFTSEEAALTYDPGSHLTVSQQQNFMNFTYVAPSGLEG